MILFGAARITHLLAGLGGGAVAGGGAGMIGGISVLTGGAALVGVAIGLGGVWVYNNRKKKKHGDAEPEVKPERRKILKAVVGYTKKSAYVEFKPDDIIDYMKKNHIHVNSGTVRTGIISKRCFDPKSPSKKHIYYERVNPGTKDGFYRLHDPLNNPDIDPSW